MAQPLTDMKALWAFEYTDIGIFYLEISDSYLKNH
jgi:hypothetical protein